jgi:hypothetical protein
MPHDSLVSRSPVFLPQSDSKQNRPIESLKSDSATPSRNYTIRDDFVMLNQSETIAVQDVSPLLVFGASRRNLTSFDE